MRVEMRYMQAAGTYPARKREVLPSRLAPCTAPQEVQPARESRGLEGCLGLWVVRRHQNTTGAPTYAPLCRIEHPSPPRGSTCAGCWAAGWRTRKDAGRLPALCQSFPATFHSQLGHGPVLPDLSCKLHLAPHLHVAHDQPTEPGGAAPG